MEYVLQKPHLLLVMTAHGRVLRITPVLQPPVSPVPPLFVVQLLTRVLVQLTLLHQSPHQQPAHQLLVLQRVPTGHGTARLIQTPHVLSQCVHVLQREVVR